MPRGAGITLRTAEWLCDNFGDGGDAMEWVDEARDLIEYLDAHNISMKKKRQRDQQRSGVWRNNHVA